MRELLIRLRLPLLFATLVLLTLVSMLADRRALANLTRERSLGSALLEVAVPVQKVLLYPVTLTRDVWSRYVALVGLREENDRLRGRVSELEEENLQYAEAIVASGHLQEIAAMREGFEVPLHSAQVVGHDVSPWFRSVLIDRGRSHDVRSGMPVVTDRGLVGLVTATSPHAARDAAPRPPERGRRHDPAEPRARHRPRHRYGRARAHLHGPRRRRAARRRRHHLRRRGAHPKGIRIGKVIEVHADESNLLHTATLQPAVDFGRLEQVFVMLHRGPTMDLLYGGDGDLPSDAAAAPAAAAKP